ncbi:hypothetical protein CKO15_10830 [Halorhodospira abdelmalekii]|uniref:hypothetical protein n=1 Tax=Halorhodospira abdelmalekii TaxID=421629 RepID=UPI00190904D7|nr:hypothetical protein [Halorhodospira abdelmalekii]MBK1735763.1 hypothetical protein [Halorhodospira abdelmalekii]
MRQAPLEADFFVRMRPGAWAPRRASSGSGWDLRAVGGHRLAPHTHGLVPTGYSLKLPPGHVVLLCPRQGTPIAPGVRTLNLPAVVGPEDDGELDVVLENRSDRPVTITAGTTLVRLLLLPSGHFFGQASALAGRRREGAGIAGYL